MRSKGRLARFLFSSAIFFLGGCAALAEKSGQILDGSAFEEKTLETYMAAEGELILRRVRFGEGDEGLVLGLSAWPALKFRFVENGGLLMPISCSFLSPSLSGWNEFTLDLLGEGTIRAEEGHLVVRIGFLEAAGMSQGRIRRFDTRLSGEEALGILRNRRERIALLAAWMKEYQRAEGLPGPSPKSGQKKNRSAGQRAFERYWKVLLFPELFPPGRRPPSYHGEGAQMVRGEGVRWNSDYTGALFPEILRPLRDSGTLLRDWEEAAAWIYLVHQWDDIIKQTGREWSFERIPPHNK
ncbi:MAG: hypothetical protein LBD31_09215 [Treponema sp.]|jgi:hypothetical protein|nr:hypothetical protein [Treponema sp.]